MPPQFVALVGGLPAANEQRQHEGLLIGLALAVALGIPVLHVVALVRRPRIELGPEVITYIGAFGRRRTFARDRSTTLRGPWREYYLPRVFWTSVMCLETADGVRVNLDVRRWGLQDPEVESTLAARLERAR
ncbi:MAG: hypothetical protein H7287_03880 [Thermoleophilia bacterium]|nr:hypothetical protein [Thermoleophilia bacterium]